MLPDDQVIEKKTLHAGTKSVDFKNGTKVYFHFRTTLCDEQKTLIDDSRACGGKPFELVLGKQFKLPVWETMVQKLALNEVATFTVNKLLVQPYPFVSRAVRDLRHKRAQKHSCAFTIQTEGMGYDDLTALFRDPQDLEFTFELLKVENEESYDKETWLMTEEEKLAKVPALRQQGNEAFACKDNEGAAEHYGKAIAIIEELMIKEKPHDEEWNKLEEMKVPLLLNYAQCKLNLGEYYSTIEHCTTVLKTSPNNVKAYYRRAKANVGAWNAKEAFDDFNKVIELEPNLTGSIKKELVALAELQKQKDCEDKNRMKNLFT